MLRLSFRGFSEGGNFSSTEIEHYKLILHALNSDIEDMESQILSGLDGMEIAHFTVLDDVFASFKATHDAHLTDVTLYDEMRRRLSNCMVVIRGEVAGSNAGGEDVEGLVLRLDRLMVDDGLTLVALTDLLRSVLGAIRLRFKYLNGVPRAPAKSGKEESLSVAEVAEGGKRSTKGRGKKANGRKT